VIFHKTLVNIRKKYGPCRAKLAQALGCTEDYIAALEENKEQATFDFVIKIKDAFNLHTAPIFESERNTLMDNLYNWKRAIDHADLDVAAKLKPELEESARLSFSPSTEIFYDLFAADYYYHVGDDAAYNETMAALSNRMDEFGLRHRYQYQRLLGAKAFVEKRYQDAIKAYKAAERLDPSGSWHDVRFYFGLGMSLSDRGYATRAIDYLERAKHITKYDKTYNGKSNRRFDVYIDGYLSSDLSKVGRSEEALRILETRLAIEKKKNSRVGIGYTYFCYGNMHQRTKKHESAIESYDNALKCLNTDESGHVESIYQKAVSLNAINRMAEAIDCVDKGLSTTKDEHWIMFFDALKHYILMNDDINSVDYLEKTLIPKLQESGQSEAVGYYYQKLSYFYNEQKNDEIAFKYSNLALETYNKLHKECIERDM